MTRKAGPGAAVFELTVPGGLGPSLEAALAGCTGLGLHATTVLRLCRDGVDLVETYWQLVRRGFEVADIIRVDRAQGQRHEVPPASKREKRGQG
jgi:hypothetical protein